MRLLICLAKAFFTVIDMCVVLTVLEELEALHVLEES